MARTLDIEIGTIVRATYPNARWGAGVVVHTYDDSARDTHGRRLKPYVVMRHDGEFGHFHEDQIEVVVEDEEPC